MIKGDQINKTEVLLPALMDQKAFAAYIGKSIAWVEKARCMGGGPRYVKLGRNVRYRAEDVLAWLEENARS